MTTIFKKIINKEIPAAIVYEDEFCLCFKDIAPQAPVHLLLIPKKEIKSIQEVKQEHSELMAHLMLKIPEIANSQGISSYRLVTNCGESAGQSVFHLHFHILAGRNFSWPPG